MPRAEWKALSPKQQLAFSKGKGPKRFLDFNIHTSQVNSGVQQYGAGQTNSGASKASATGSQGASSMAVPRRVRNQAALGLMATYSGKVRHAPEPNPLDAGGSKEFLLPMRELVAAIQEPSGSGYTTLASYNIQPGLTLANGGLMPYAASIAQQFERYKIMKMALVFEPFVSAVTNGGQSGKVNLSINYDSLTPAPQTWQAAVDTDPHANGMGYEIIRLDVDPTKLSGKDGKFVRSGVVANSDLKTYDAGVVYLTCNGISSSGAQLGELYCDYVIAFMNPRLNESIGTQPNNAFTLYTLSGSVTSPGTGNYNFPYVLQSPGSDPRLPGGANANPLNIVATGGTLGGTGLILPPGQFNVIARAIFTGTSAITLTTLTWYYSTNAGTTWSALQPQAYHNIGAAAVLTTDSLFDILTLSSGGTNQYIWCLVVTAACTVGTTSLTGLTLTLESV
jgi:hypothetical protein